MFKFIARRLLETVPVLFVIVTGSFFLIRLAPGGPFDSERRMTPEVQRNLNAYYGYDKPLPVQYFRYMGKLFQGDLGPSTKNASHSVNELIGESFPVSLELGCYAIAIAMALGITAGIIASLRPNTATDYVPMSLAMAGICLPTFVLGPILVLIFALWLRWFNPSGWNEPADRVLPALTLGIFYAAYLARLTRGGMLEILGQDYIRTARAKGAGELRVILKHALRGGLLPVVSYLGPALAGIISGSFVVEKIFQVPGIGRSFIESALNRDHAMIMGTVIFFAVLIIAFNLLVDVLQVFLNPRLRFD